MSEASVPGVFSTMLNAALLASQAPTVVLVPLKLNGELTEKVTSGVVPGTFAGIAFCEIASGTCHKLPLMVFACAVPPISNSAKANATTCLITCLLSIKTLMYRNNGFVRALNQQIQCQLKYLDSIGSWPSDRLANL